DSPDIAPAWLPKDQQNEPHQLRRIAQTLADQRGLSFMALAQATSQNAINALGLPHHPHQPQ
ncbi:MAG: TatD family deoxyribonuclease, partial [Burkholderiaceae bacterium]